MILRFRFSPPLFAAFGALGFLAVSAMAQTEPAVLRIRPTNRVVTPIDDGVRVVLAGSRHPLAQAGFDTGRVAAEKRLERIVLMLQPDDSQQQALEELLAAQQDPESPLFHRWLTPDEFGLRFGISPADVESVSGWLQSHGLLVEEVSAGRRQILFSGAVAQVEAAFHTEIHSYLVDGQSHVANSSDPEIPLALAPVAAGIVSLHDFHSHPLHHGGRLRGAPGPLYTSGGTHYLSPADFAAIYDVAAAYSANVNASGQSIAIAGRSNFKMADVAAFRGMFGLPANAPTVILNGADPGIVSQNEEFEAALDVEWSGAVARNASIQFVLSASTSATDGVTLSAQYIVNHNVAPVVSLSFGTCEASSGASGNQLWNSLWQQAAGQGMTVLVAAGDSGAAGCDSPSGATAQKPAGVNALCSTPYSTCVGGTQFADTASPGSYWAAANNTVTGGSALGYIPETAWNESGSVAGGSDLWATGGGESTVYAKPSWQTGAGVPTDGRRGVPDVALTAASHDGYLVRMENALYVVSGTSASAPAFAGLMSLVAQKTGARPGNANPALYALAGRQATGGAAVFHDVTSGANTVPGLTGFSATPGYDPVTGLGSVDANLMINHWTDGVSPVSPAMQLSVTPGSVSLAAGTVGPVTVNVTVSGGFNFPVTLSTGTLPSGLSASFSPTSFTAPGAGTSTLKITASAQTVAAAYNLTVTANGGGLTQTFALSVAIAPACTYSLTPTSATVPAAAGAYTVNVTAPAGCTWSASPVGSWLAVTGAGTGSGNGAVTYSVGANSTTAARSGSLTIAGLAFPVTQSAASTAAYTLSPPSATVGAAGGQGSLSVTVNPSSTFWTAAASAAWISVTSGASGAGSRSVGYSVAANTAPAARSGSLTIGSATFTITQAAACVYSVAAGNITHTNSGWTGSIAVTTASGCSWTATSSASWLGITSGVSGSGSGAMTYLAANNTASTSRSAIITVAGYAFTFTEGPGLARPAVEVVPVEIE